MNNDSRIKQQGLRCRLEFDCAREILVRGWKSQPWTMNLHRSRETEDKSPEVEGKDRTWGAL